MSSNGTSWDKSIILALITLLVAILTLVATFTIPEIREFCGLDKPAELKSTVVQNPEPEDEKEEPPEKVKIPEPAGPVFLTIHEDQSQFVEAAQTRLSLAFHDLGDEEIASLTIAPVGKASSTHAVLNGYTQEFTVSTDTFLVQILSIDYKRKTIYIQVTRTLSDDSR